jgi:hypothetical protein
VADHAVPGVATHRRGQQLVGDGSGAAVVVLQVVRVQAVEHRDQVIAVAGGDARRAGALVRLAGLGGAEATADAQHAGTPHLQVDVAATAVVVRGEVADQRQSVLEMGDRLDARRPRGRPLTGARPRVDGLARPTGLGEVAGAHLRAFAVVARPKRRQSVGDPAVHLPPSRPQHRLVGDVAHQRVLEDVRA